MKASAILAILAITLTTVACAKSQTANHGCKKQSTACSDSDNNGSVYKFAKVVFEFTSDFLCELLNTNPNKNVNGSPLAYLYEIGLQYLFSFGKTEHGLRRALNCISKEQLLDVLKHLNDAALANTRGVTYTANGTIIIGSTEIEFTDYFNDVLEQVILARSLNVDYKNPVKAVRLANNLVSEQTDGKITNILTDTDTFSDLLQLLRLSGFYFQAQFRYEFTDGPEPGHFYGAAGVEEANYVYQTEIYRYGNNKILDSQVLQVEYINGYSIFFLKPNEGANICFILKKIRSLQFALTVFDGTEETPVRFGLPLIDNITTLIDSADAFQKYLNLDSILDKGAQFENITKNNECVYFGNSRQKFVFKSSNGGGPSRGVPEGSKVVDFILDRPFLYFVSFKVEVNAEVQFLNLPFIVGYRATV